MWHLDQTALPEEYELLVRIRTVQVAEDLRLHLSRGDYSGRIYSTIGESRKHHDKDAGEEPALHRSPSTTKSFPIRRTVTWRNVSAWASASGYGRRSQLWHPASHKSGSEIEHE